MASIFDPSGLTIPDFFLVGPKDGGIEHLSTMLDSHPDLSLPGPTGGVRWFSNDRSWNKGLVPYAAKFESQKLGGFTVGDKSDTYLEPKSIVRMFIAAPTAKVILMLQCPTDRWLIEQQGSSKTEQSFFDTQNQALAQGFYHGLTSQIRELWPFAKIWITTREQVEADIAFEVGEIITFIGADNTKPWNALPFTKDHTDSPVREDELNLIYGPGFAEFKAELLAAGFTDLDTIDDWCPPPPTPPVAVDDLTFNTPIDTLLNVAAPGVLSNDTDVNLTDVLVVNTPDVKVHTTANGSATLNADGSFSYLPTGGFSGTNTFTYRCFDGIFGSVNPATVKITIP